MLKNHMKRIWRWEPDRRSNFFNPPAHLCAVTYSYMTEISLIVSLNNQFNSFTSKEGIKNSFFFHKNTYFEIKSVAKVLV